MRNRQVNPNSQLYLDNLLSLLTKNKIKCQKRLFNKTLKTMQKENADIVRSLRRDVWWAEI